MKILVAASCALTILAVSYLSFSLLMLRPPRANYTVWFPLAAAILIQSFATLVAVVSPTAWLRAAVAGGGAALAAIAVWMMRETLTGAHFEGYALLLGAMLLVQGFATLGAFARSSQIRHLRA
jgi:hypothetical protein